MAPRSELGDQQLDQGQGAGAIATDDLRGRLLAGLPVSERRLDLADVDTAVLEGGEGPPLLLLHGPGGNATHWARVIPELVKSNCVVVPDLPGQGTSEVGGGELTAERILSWLGELIEQTCESQPALVGFTLGGAISARFAAERSDQLTRLVLVDTLGLRELQPAPQFGQVAHAFQEDPSEDTHDLLWQQCMLDLDRVREGLGEWWEPFKAYNLELARTETVAAGLGSLMGHFGMPAIPEAELERIAVPTTLVWGRQDLATPLEVAEAASARYGWPLHVIENCADEPPFEQPEAFLAALRTVLPR